MVDIFLKFLGLFWKNLFLRGVPEFEFMNEKYGKIKPEKGMMIAFPADLDWVHRVNTVTKGDRYTMASWYTDDKSHWNYVNEGWSGTIGV